MPDSHEPASSSQNSAGESTDGTELRVASTPGATPAAGGTVPLATGMLLAERFEIREPLGSGGMGKVFEAFDRLAQETVAIKVLREDLYFSAEAKARFFAEARISRTLSHPNIVRVHDVGSAGDRHFLTMERLRGQSLRDRIERYKQAGQSFALAEVLDIARQLIDSLRYANRYIVHRDVKPENVWLGEDGRVKLMDFGIARIFTDLRNTRFMLGTPYYMAPEQRRDPESVDWPADMYAVGVILYELLTGGVPEGAILPPHVVRRDVPRAVSNAVLIALAPMPKARFASWDAFQQALNSASTRLPPATLAKWLGGAAAVLVAAFLAWSSKPVVPSPAKPGPQIPPLSLGPIGDDRRVITAAQPPPSVTNNELKLGDSPQGGVLSGYTTAPKAGPTVLPNIVQLIEQRLVGTMLSIPAGELALGDSVGGGDADERPVVRKRIGAFRLGRAEVTRAQFAAFVTATQYQTEAERDGRGCNTITSLVGAAGGTSWRDPGFPQTEAHPVVCVSWNDAKAFIDWVNQQTKEKFRLPTEAEWEYAARSGSTARYPWGPAADPVCKYANGMDLTPSPNQSNAKLMGLLAEIPCSDGFYYTAPVASLAPNGFGLYDMIGNVEEWTADCYYSTYTGSASQQLIRDVSPCTSRVVRGGSRSDPPSRLRVSKRAQAGPGEHRSRLGFRVAEGGQ